MQQYEFHLLGPGRSKQVISSSHINDYAAVRRAQQMGTQTEAFEVWRNGSCIYARRPPAVAYG